MRPLVGLRPPPDFLRSFTPPHYAYRISLRSVQGKTEEGILSSCGCCLTLTRTTSIGIWYTAGARKGVTSPATHRGIWHGAGATKS